MVSIIIPVYNVEKYLRICLESVLQQTYKDYEVIMVDDGSTDDSPNICCEYTQRDSRFSVIHQANMGLASARNTGIRAAKGEYIYFIDSDDCINVRLLEVAIGLAEKEQANIVQIELESVPEDYADYTVEMVEDVPVQRFSTIEALWNLDRDCPAISKDIRLTTTVVWTKLYRVAAFSSLLFPEGMRMHEDQMVAHQRIAEAGGMVFLNQPLYYYRQSSSSLIRVGWTPKRLAILDCYEERYNCIKDLPYHSVEQQELVNYIGLRYCVCIFRNYDMIDKKLKGEEQKREKKDALKRIRGLLNDSTLKLSFLNRIFYRCFSVIPMFFVMVFRMRNRWKG